MRCDDRYHAAGGQDEALAVGLCNGILRFIPDFSLLPVNQRIVSQAATHCPWNNLAVLRPARAVFRGHAS